MYFKKKGYAMSIKIMQECENSAFSALIYGTPGVGKTSFATWAPKPLVINLENGLKGVDLKQRDAFSTNIIGDWDDFILIVQQMKTSEKFQTAVIDTVTRLERLMIAHICKKAKKETLADFGYGSGYQAFEALAQAFCDHIRELVACGKNVILIAHEHIETINDPERDAYDRFNSALDKRIANAIKATVDHIFYMHKEKISISDKRAVRLARTLIQTRESGGVIAKTRGQKELFIEVKNDESSREIWTNC